jgi:hypothetical protein
MVKKLTLLLTLFLLLLVACAAPTDEPEAAAVSGEGLVIDVYRAPT